MIELKSCDICGRDVHECPFRFDEVQNKIYNKALDDVLKIINTNAFANMLEFKRKEIIKKIEELR